MKQPVQDERIIMQRRKTDTETLYLLQISLGVAILVQFFFLRAPLAQIAAELVCLLAAMAYSTMRNTMAGAGTDAQPGGAHSTKQLLIKSLGLGALSTFSFVTLAGDERLFVLAAVFFSISALSLGAGLALRALTRRRLRDMDAALAQDDDA